MVLIVLALDSIIVIEQTSLEVYVYIYRSIDIEYMYIFIER